MTYTASGQLNISKILKILNINAIAQFVLKDYEGIHFQKLCISTFNNFKHYCYFKLQDLF